MKKIIYILSIITLAFTFNSCESETSILDIADDIGFTGSTEDIQDFLGAGNYQALLDLGVTVYSGNTPPQISGTYLISPNTLAASNLPDEPYPIGTVFFNDDIRFSNQDNSELTIDFSGRTYDNDGNIVSSESGEESFVSGTGDDFTVIVKVNSTSTDSNGNTVSFVKGIAISGTKSTNGILNTENAFIIITKTGDVNDEYIDEGEGRLLIDGDEFSENF